MIEAIKNLATLAVTLDMRIIKTRNKGSVDGKI